MCLRFVLPSSSVLPPSPAFKEMLMTPENSPRPRSRKPSDVHGLTDPNNHLNLNSNFASMNLSGDPNKQSPKDKGKAANNKGSSVTNKANRMKKKVLDSSVVDYQ